LRTTRGVAVIAGVAAAALLLAACGSDKKTTTPSAAGSNTSAAGSSGLKIGLAYDIGGRGDKSFNDAAAAGLDAAKAKYNLGANDVKELSRAG